VSGVDPAGEWFEVSLIPTTLALTTLGDRAVGDIVNLEADVIAKYVEGLVRVGGGHD
jgi:riboflavin synthase